jgi:hypothetical protein
MKQYWHQNMASGRWHTLSVSEQLGNVGSEFERAIRWGEKGDDEHREQALDRMFELMDLTVADPRWLHTRRLRELARTRETLKDFFYGANEYNGNSEAFKKYFFYFALDARKDK